MLLNACTPYWVLADLDPATCAFESVYSLVFNQGIKFTILDISKVISFKMHQNGDSNRFLQLFNPVRPELAEIITVFSLIRCFVPVTAAVMI